MGGTSQSSTTQTTTSTAITDSYNRTLEQVINMSNVGNISVGSGGAAAESSLLSSDGIRSFALLGAVAVGAFFILRR